MTHRITALWRHPVKGFTPEPLDHAALSVGQGFPMDRLYAIEHGPSGFDPDSPAFIPKTKFTVLASMAMVARARTRLDDASGLFKASAEGLADLAVDLTGDAGRRVLADWVGQLLGDEVIRPLQVLSCGRDGHRFMDHPMGHVSVLNLASVRDLEFRTGHRIDPLRFRANVWVEGWPAWVEQEWAGRDIRLGAAKVRVYKPIVRCAATEVNPETADRDLELVRLLFETCGHRDMGIYVQVSEGAQISIGQPVEVIP